MEDSTPAWMTLVKWIAVAAAVGGVIYLLVATGFLAVIRAGVGWIAAFVPSASTTRAKFDAQDLAAGTANREAIAAQRAVDPVYNEALKRQKEVVRTQTQAQPQKETQ
jgi:hypothetical protein